MATFHRATAFVFYVTTLMAYLYSIGYDIVYVHFEGEKDYIGKFNFFTVWNLHLANVMSTSLTSCAFYPVAALFYIYTLWFNVMFVRIGNSGITTYGGYGGKFKYLTFWNHCLQTVYFALCSLNALVGSNIPASVSPSRRSRLQRLRDVIHSSLAFPVGAFVVMTFWALYAVDRELVYPRELDKIIPQWLNHVMHTTVLPLLLVDKYLVYHHHPRRHNGIFILSAFAFLYLLWILWIAYSANIWVYPVLRMMQGYERAIFIMFLLMFFISIYLLGEAVTKFLWRKEKAILLASMKKKQ